MEFNIQNMTIDHYDDTIRLWSSSEGVGLSNADSIENIARYLDRNPGTSFVAYENHRLIGAVLCGHDGRRGYIHHLAVEVSHRQQGVGKALINKCLTALKAVGIDKCHLFVFSINEDAQAFWHKVGWSQRTDLVVMSSYTS